MTAPDTRRPGSDATMDWAIALQPGERLLWQGRPVPGLTLTREGITRLAVAVFFLFNGWLWLGQGLWLGYAFLAAALWLVAEVTLMPLARQRVTAYALTDRRALIRTRWPLLGAHLKSWPLTRDTIVTADQSEPFGHVSFGFVPVFLWRTRVRAVGFDRIPDAARVYALIRRIQKGQAMPEDPQP